MKIVKSTAVPLPIENIDTDQIIPSRFLKVITREGFGENLFQDWRYDAQGKPNKDFVLNNPVYSGEILVAGRNFGCGSSREHAAWALKEYGFNVVISSFFADIFKSNALNNFLLPIQVSDLFLVDLFYAIEENSKVKIIIDLPKQKVEVPTHKMSENFDISSYKKMCLIEGFDDVGYLLSQRSKTEAFEKRRDNNFDFRNHQS